MTANAILEQHERFSQRSRFSDEAVDEVAQGGRAVIAEWVVRSAREEGITPRRSSFAQAVSRLSDGVTDLDEVEETLVALSKAGVISAKQCGVLHFRYYR